MTDEIEKPKSQLSSRIMIRLLDWQRDRLKARAEKIGVPDSTLGRMYILEKLGEDEK